MLKELVTAVHERRLHPRQLVQHALDQIARLDPAINAVTETCAEQALFDADRNDGRGPLAGIPVLVKDLFAARGTRNTFGGSMLFADAPPSEADDPTVKALRDAGAIVIGRNNSPSFGHLGITTNPLFGPTRNPWNLERTPGGSSGGAGAALAAGLAGIATSSDAGGSTRCPASNCGVVGYKPSAGLFIMPQSHRVLGSATVGAMGVSVDDCLREAHALIGPSPGNMDAPPAGSVSLAPRLPRRLLVTPTLTGRVTPGIRAQFEAICVQISEALKLPLIEVASPFTDEDIGHFATTFCAETRARMAPYRERWNALEGTLRMVLDLGQRKSGAEVAHTYLARYAMMRRADMLLGTDTVWLTPVVNTDSHPAGPHLRPGPLDDVTRALIESELDGGFNTMYFNMTGLPALSVPMGMDTHGVPVGLQVIAPKWQDALAFGIAELVERIRPWAHAAPGYSEFGSELL